MIYFISNATTGSIKIGYSKNPSKRLFTLQTASPDQLSLLGTIKGGLEHEAAYHEQFAQHRLQGEWFGKAILSDVMAIMEKETASPAKATTNVLIAGDTDFTRTQYAHTANFDVVHAALNEIHAATPIAWIVTAGERTLEVFAWDWARKSGARLYRYFPKWRSRGRSAPFQTSAKMLRSMFDPKVLLVFQCEVPSPSTISLIRRANRAGIPVIVKADARVGVRLRHRRT